MKEMIENMVEAKKSELGACRSMLDEHLDNEDYLRCYALKLHIEILRSDINALQKVLRRYGGN